MMRHRHRQPRCQRRSMPSRQAGASRWLRTTTSSCPPQRSTLSSITTNAGTVELAPFSALHNLLGAGGICADHPYRRRDAGSWRLHKRTGWRNHPSAPSKHRRHCRSTQPERRHRSDAKTGRNRCDHRNRRTHDGRQPGRAVQGSFASLTQPANLIGTLDAIQHAQAGFALANNQALLVGLDRCDGYVGACKRSLR